MGAGCVVLFCKNKGPIPGVNYYTLTSKRYLPWMKALGRDPVNDKLSIGNKVCSDHFVENDFVYIKNKRRVKPTAVPSLKLGPRRPPLSVQNKVLSGTSGESVSSELDNNLKLNTGNKENIFCVPCPMDSPKSSVSSSPAKYFEEDSEPKIKSSVPLKGNTHRKRKLIVISSSSDSEGYRGHAKKIRRDVKTFHNYSASPRHVTKKFEEAKKHVKLATKKLKTSKQRVNRLTKKVTHLRQVLCVLQKKKIISDKALEVLEKSYSGIPFLLMRRYIENIKRGEKGKKQGRKKFPEELRSFALTLQFYSSKAYNYVRNVFNLALPAPSTIRSWISNINCEPGFSDCCFLSLKRIFNSNKSKNMETICSLVLDEMSIKKQVDFINNRTWGYENIGTGIEDDEMKCATEALVLLVVSVNGNWKLPVAYFLINSLTGSEKANIVKETLIRLHQVGVRITSVTCDGPSANFTMAEKLGARVNDINNIQPYFLHPIDGSKVYVIFDPCHMIKLLRNNWGTHNVFIDKYDRRIDFNYIKKLQTIEEVEYCRLGTKLRRAHLNWHQQKMKVNLAAQTISNSVADALEFLKTDIQHPDFKDAEGTIYFLRLFDRTFDLCNSRNPFGRGSKAPLRQENERYWKPIFEEALDYTKTIKNVEGLYLYQTRAKTPFKGFYVTILSFIGIFEDYVRANDSPLKYILAYKFSQDHIELFFSCMRAKNGWNNNPTAYQFYITYKRLALRHDLKNIQGNCIYSEDIDILTTTGNIKKISPQVTLDDISVCKKYNMNITDLYITEDDIEYIVQFLPSLSTLTENIVVYVSGFVLKKLKKIIKCFECLEKLETVSCETIDAENFKFLKRKDRGGLIKPSTDVIKICMYCEKKIRFILDNTNYKLPQEKNFFYLLVKETTQQLCDQKVLHNLDEHIFEQAIFENHRLKVIQSTVEIYLKIRLFYMGKKNTEVMRGACIRKKFSKLVLFYNQ